MYKMIFSYSRVFFPILNAGFPSVRIIPLQRGRLRSCFELGFFLIIFLIFALKKKEPQGMGNSMSPDSYPLGLYW